MKGSPFWKKTKKNFFWGGGKESQRLFTLLSEELLEEPFIGKDLVTSPQKGLSAEEKGRKRGFYSR